MVALVKQSVARPERLTTSRIEAAFVGKLGPDEVLELALSTPEELEQRRERIDRALEALRAQLKSTPGAQPEALLFQFSSLKAQRALIEADLARRQQR